MEELIQKYLKENNVEGKNGVDYYLENNGNGIEIKNWTLQIAEPSFTSNEIALESAKNSKKVQLKINRDIALNKATMSITAGGVECEFYLRTVDLPALKGKIDSLSNNNNTKTWGDINGKRINLNKTALERLEENINTNDARVWDYYGEKLVEIEEATTLEEVAAVNINFNLD